MAKAKEKQTIQKKDGISIHRRKSSTDMPQIMVLPFSPQTLKSVMPNIPAMDNTIVTFLKDANYIRPPYDIERVAKWIELNTTHQACINAKALMIAGNGFEITTNEKEWTKEFKKFIDQPNAIFGETLQDIIRNLVYDLEVWNNGYLQIRKGVREIAIYNVKARNIFIKPYYDAHNRAIAGRVEKYLHIPTGTLPFESTKSYTYEPFTGNIGRGKTALHHFKGSSLKSDYYGEPTYLSIQNAIQESGYVSEFNINFFSNNAQPNYVIGVTGVKMSKAKEQAFKDELTEHLKGISNAHRGLVLIFDNDKAKIDVKEISKTYDESFSKLKKDIAEVISTAHLMPMELLPQSGTSNFGGGTATIGALKVFLEMVIKPRQTFVEDKLNKLMTALFGFDPKIKLKSIKITTEKDDAVVHVMYKKEGILTADEIREDLKRKELGDVIRNDAPTESDANVTIEGESRIEDINTDSNNRGVDAVTDV